MNRLLVIALVAMFFQQSFATLAKNVIPIVAPAALPDLGGTAAWVGYFTSFSAFVQIFIMVACGNFIRRFGGLRVSQVGLVFIAVGLCCAASGYLWPFLITAFTLTVGTASATPASSQILARVAPPKQAPLVFSAKQTSVPFGIMIAGFVLPLLVLHIGWQGAFLVAAAMCAGFAIVLQPTRRELDQDRDPSASLSPQGIKHVIAVIKRTPDLRMLAATMFAFVGLQMSYSAFLVLFLTDRLDYSLAEAGSVFALATLIGIPARIVWGWVASSISTPRLVLAGLGAAMSVSAVLTGFYSLEWVYWQILVVAVAMTSTALGWHGVLLSEVARLSPPGHAGGITGGVLAVSAMGQIVIPLSFSAILSTSGNYTYAFAMAGVPPAVIAAVWLLRGPSAPR